MKSKTQVLLIEISDNLPMNAILPCQATEAPLHNAVPISAINVAVLVSSDRAECDKQKQPRGRH